MFHARKGPAMTIDYLKTLVIEQVQNADDADLLDFVLKLLISESRDQGLDAGILVSG